MAKVITTIQQHVEVTSNKPDILARYIFLVRAL